MSGSFKALEGLWKETVNAVYQTSHFCAGFIGDPTGQLKSFENSTILLMGPSTRNWPGECTPVVIRIFMVSGR